ncbi:MAG: hypothetical protein ACC652_10000 [Acidimicrobiales bacterium]
MTLTPEGEDLEFACPRCGSEVKERFYGPCPSCVTALHDSQGGEGRELEIAAFEPKMNVTPNQVASKE